MASLIFTVLGTINDVYIIKGRLRETSVFDRAFSFRRWTKEVHRYRLKRNLEVYLNGANGLIKQFESISNCRTHQVSVWGRKASLKWQIQVSKPHTCYYINIILQEALSLSLWALFCDETQWRLVLHIKILDNVVPKNQLRHWFPKNYNEMWCLKCLCPQADDENVPVGRDWVGTEKILPADLITITPRTTTTISGIHFSRRFVFFEITGIFSPSHQVTGAGGRNLNTSGEVTMAPDVVYSCPLITEAREGQSFYVRGRVLKTCER